MLNNLGISHQDLKFSPPVKPYVAFLRYQWRQFSYGLIMQAFDQPILARKTGAVSARQIMEYVVI